MSKRNSTQYSFTDFVLERKTKSNDFLDKVNLLINWHPISAFLQKKLNRKANAVGNPAYPALTMFKILLLQRWYNLSDPETEEHLLDRLSFVRFIDFSLEQDIPDETTICRFRNGLIKLNILEQLLEMINSQLQEHNLLVKEGSIVDATVVSSCNRPRKAVDIIPEDRDEESQNPTPQTVPPINTEQEKLPKTEISYSKDTDAKWLAKRGVFYYGYKAHVAVDHKSGYVLAGHVTGANKSDTGEFQKVVKAVNLSKNSPVYADKGYTSASNRDFLQANNLVDNIMHKAKKNKPLQDNQKAQNKEISKIRYIVERSFGSLKRLYNFSRARYRGIKKVNAELHLISIAFNIKKASYCIA